MAENNVGCFVFFYTCCVLCNDLKGLDVKDFNSNLYILLSFSCAYYIATEFYLCWMR